ncbi:protein-disulfide reductase DsbD family protein [Sphingomonas jaspsi]|uniref:protein-disulfide reductase DsbD family protein n=1 Tax=Sphingomonas jaspsi TaxID=392409 RepID=UPI0004AD75DE|nr:thioredoxin family protein [Sphingomonas jaspsi]
MRFLRQLLLMLAMFAPSIALAQLPRQNAIQPELVLEARGVPGGEAELAILMHTTPGWHGYWLNPGDAGLPMSVEWTLPKGWSVGELRYPVPGRLLVAGIENYVYEKDYAVLTRLNIPAGTTGSQMVSAKLRYLACTDRVCVPEQADVSLSVPTGGMVTPDSRFNEWRRALPRPLASEAHFRKKGDRIEIAVPLPASVTIGQPYFFPSTDGPIDYGAEQQYRRDGDLLIASLKQRKGDPAELKGVLALGDGRGLDIHAVPGPVPDGGSAVGAIDGNAIFYAILGALVGGMLLNLMPCVFPILALKALHLARSGGDEAAARKDALAYAAGAVVGTGLLGALLLAIRAGGSAAGWAFQLQDPRTIIVLLLLAVAITLNLLRVYELPVMAGEANPRGSFGTGALAAFVATPCAGPFLGAALGTALLLPAAGSVLVFAALGLGIALPFVAVAFVPPLRNRLPSPGAWMARLQRFLAIPMAATAAGCLWLLYRLGGVPAAAAGVGAVVLLGVLLWWYGRRQHGEAGGWLVVAATLALAGTAAALVPQAQRGEAQVPLGATAWSDDALSKARASGKPVFLYFTADWCLSCKANEAAAIEREATREAFDKAGVIVMVGDWTNGDPAITRFLETRGRAGVPLYLWYEPGKEPEELPQILTPSMLATRAERAR